VPIDRLEIRFGPGYLNEILGGTIEGAFAADAEIGSGGGDQRLGLRQDQAHRHGGRRGREILGQLLALVGVEHRESFEERDRFRLVALALGAASLLVRTETIGIDDGCALFPFSYIAAKTERLAKGEPALTGEAVLDHRTPEDEHVDSGVASPGRGILRHGKRRLGRGRAPRLDPGKRAPLPARR
jgi:hypothetical protein